jgi:Peptidyl-prolyl cis-trans isomerase (rotamase) - cyclophilin family
MITLHTNYGDIVVELDFDKAPKTAANFLQYCKDDFYAGTIFHRVIDGFMVQGGGMDENMQEKPGRDPIENEADNGLSNDTGTLAMARTNDPHSASSQFFINVNDNHFLNHSGKNMQGWGYAVFGKVADGMDTVKKIKGVPTGSKGFHQDVPKDLVIIERVTVSDDYAAK